MNTSSKTQSRIRRHNKIRARIAGTSARPRLSLYKSNRYLHAQLIDDEAGKTLVSSSTKDIAKKAKKMDAAKKLGADIATKAKAAGITKVVFDRGGFRYAGRVATAAQAARMAGLEF